MMERSDEHEITIYLLDGPGLDGRASRRASLDVFHHPFLVLSCFSFPFPCSFPSSFPFPCSSSPTPILLVDCSGSES